MKYVFVTLLFAIKFNLFSQPLTEIDSTQFFDFWVGEWTASWDEGEGVKEYGANTISKSLDEKVIVENFRVLDGLNQGFKGTSISVFQPSLNRWKQAWADNQGGYYDFLGVFEDDKRIFRTRENDGRYQRMVFYDIKENSMTWDWEGTRDGGRTWNLNWRIYYERKE